MARQEEESIQAWGTLEELLLACAVNRHGTKSWDSIAMEVQNRTSTLSSLTSQNCKDKFKDLKRRFVSKNDTPSIVDQLRQIRVEELRREVQQRDVSIESLELKVKRLEEERERCLREEADLITRKKSDSVTAGEDSGDERDNRSFNESNSTGQQKPETTIARQHQNDDVETEPQNNINTSTNNINNNNDINVKPDPDNENGEDPERSGSDALDDKIMAKGIVKKADKKQAGQTTGGESKREEKEKQNNSDVQSSVSLSQNKKKRRRRGGDRAGTSSGEEQEPEGGDQVAVSPATRRIPAVKTEPLAKLIGLIRSHRLGSTFERRLRSQESERYKKLIRQHIDLQTIQSRLDKGAYSFCIQKFFRDLLLLFNNAIIFFRKNSPEHLAACELRALVREQMTQKLAKPKSDPVKPEPNHQPPASLSKPNNRSSSTIVVCGKNKATPEYANKKGDKKDREVELKQKYDEKKIESFVKIEDKGIRKKRTKDRSAPSHRNSNTTSKKNGDIKHQYGGNELSSHDALEMKVERKGTTARKKQGAASFLKRIKQNSPSEATDNEDDDDDNEDNDNDSSEDESKDNKGKEEKGRRGGKNVDRITERVTRSSRGRGTRDNGRGKRATTRRPLRSQPEKVQSGGGAGKRGRESGGSEAGSGGTRARKRSKR